jgi:hypothetical protein
MNTPIDIVSKAKPVLSPGMPLGVSVVGASGVPPAPLTALDVPDVPSAGISFPDVLPFPDLPPVDRFAIASPTFFH